MATNAALAGATSAIQTNRIIRRAMTSDLNRFGLRARNALLQASPELGRIARYLDSRYSGHMPKDLLDAHQDRIRSAQAARGFGGGGSGVAGEEARYLTGLVEQQRMQLLPFAQQFGESILAGTGFGAQQYLTPESALNMWATHKQTRLAEKQFRHQRTMSYVNTGLSVLGGLTGGIGAIAGAAGQFQQNRLAQQQYGFNQQYGPAMYQAGMAGLQAMQRPQTQVGAYGLIGSGSGAYNPWANINY